MALPEMLMSAEVLLIAVTKGKTIEHLWTPTHTHQAGRLPEAVRTLTYHRPTPLMECMEKVV
jgi:hypothetical protein